jgi:hypothetical protein
MRINNRWTIEYIGWKGSLFIWNDFRLNGAGSILSAMSSAYGYSPYHCWRLGPVIIKRYV